MPRRKPTTYKRPRRCTEAELAKVGVTIVDPTRGRVFSCDHCNEVWSPKLGPGGRNPRGYWKCPNGCNWK